MHKDTVRIGEGLQIVHDGEAFMAGATYVDVHIPRGQQNARSVGRTGINGVEIMDQTGSSKLYERDELDFENMEISHAGRIAGADDSKRWYGSISLSQRIADKELSRERVDGAFNHMKQYFVQAFRSARLRCVDGRVAEGYDDDRENMKKAELGPQIAGGTAGAAVCFRLARGPENDTYATTSFETDLESFAGEIRSMGFELGGHTDDIASEKNTGCGAIDKMPEIIKVMTKTENATRLKELTKALLGEKYDAKIYSEILGNAVLLQSEAGSYFSEYKKTILDKIRQQSRGAIQKLIGKHNEVAAIVNRVYGYTWHRDEFSADNQHQIQAFNYDFWYSVELTNSLMKNNPYLQSLSENRRQIEGQKILTARVMYTVSTLMTLTDGSIDLYVVDEKNDEGNVINIFDRYREQTGAEPTRQTA